MKLYYIPGACSRAANILLREAGIEPELVLVDPATKKTSEGGDYLDINPLGYVPALQLDDGTILTENAAVLQWIADTYGPKPSSDLERAKLVQELSYVSSELHKAFSPFFAAQAPEGEAREALIAKLRTRIAHYEATYLNQDRGFGVAQAYAFVVLCWAGYQKIDISDFTAVEPFLASVGERASVQAAIEAEMALIPA
uniref:glutathione S-transferase N-terminal domain-containing protein n=1 Tax=uncultured Altererythrobacter sp. TaxID=500840 RepID=UPI0026123778|nr:glutathione S-transferase N-terminal domain-containing protein [uncultured Altererythrobacter sp.]